MGTRPSKNLALLKQDISESATDVREERDPAVLKISYRLEEETEGKTQSALYGFAVDPSGHVQIAIYFDDEKDMAKARQIFSSLAPVSS